MQLLSFFFHPLYPRRIAKYVATPRIKNFFIAVKSTIFFVYSHGVHNYMI